MCSCKAFLHARRIRHILLLILVVLIGVEANNIPADIYFKHVMSTSHSISGAIGIISILISIMFLSNT
jgi:hypothetical protein